MPRISLDSLDLAAAERTLIVEALAATGSLIDAAVALGVSTRVLGKKMVHHGITWPRAPDDVRRSLLR